MKEELADKLGLTEKHVSGWFFHRRLKDKRLLRHETYAAGRQDLSSGVIQDRGSGLRQDSCGSTKQAVQKPADLREVESRRLCGQDHPTLELTYEQRRQYDISGMDGTSSEGSSDLQENLYPLSRDFLDVKTSQYVMPNRFIGKSRERMGPSGYLKIKGQTENAAITAVKRQLGQHYREDGPLLGVDFDPLPPGAFESSKKHTVRELVGAVMLLPNNKFRDFSAAVLANWVISNSTMLFNSLKEFLEKLQKKNGDVTLDWVGVINQSAFLYLLKYLEEKDGVGISVLEKFSLNISEIKARIGDPAVAINGG